MVRFSHFEVNLLDSTIPERSKSGAQERSGDAAPTKIGGYGQVENLAGSRHLTSDEVAGNAFLTMGD